MLVLLFVLFGFVRLVCEWGMWGLGVVVIVVCVVVLLVNVFYVYWDGGDLIGLWYVMLMVGLFVLGLVLIWGVVCKGCVVIVVLLGVLVVINVCVVLVEIFVLLIYDVLVWFIVIVGYFVYGDLWMVVSDYWGWLFWVGFVLWLVFVGVMLGGLIGWCWCYDFGGG